MTEKPLNDTEAYDRLHAALMELGTAPGATVAADTALTAARRALVLLQMGIVKSGEADQEPFTAPEQL